MCPLGKRKPALKKAALVQIQYSLPNFIKLMIAPICDICGEDLKEFGAILLSPPDIDVCIKQHIFCGYFERESLRVVNTSSDENSFDIIYDDNLNHIELGSYGIRACNFLKWIYGTATAEPRLSYAYGLSQKKN